MRTATAYDSTSGTITVDIGREHYRPALRITTEGYLMYQRLPTSILPILTPWATRRDAPAVRWADTCRRCAFLEAFSHSRGI
jgi:hypothetical protein